MKRDMRIVVKIDRRRTAALLKHANGGISSWGETDGTKVWVRGSDEKRLLTDDAIRRGLQLLATKYPERFGKYLSGSAARSTANIFVQLACFGEVIYG